MGELVGVLAAILSSGLGGTSIAATRSGRLDRGSPPPPSAAAVGAHRDLGDVRLPAPRGADHRIGVVGQHGSHMRGRAITDFTIMSESARHTGCPPSASRYAFGCLPVSVQRLARRLDARQPLTEAMP